jgi:hypothetical protein
MEKIIDSWDRMYPQGAGSSGRRVNGHTLEITEKFNGKVMDTRQMRLSPDIKTMTITVRAPGLSKPNTLLVFDRE